MVRNELKHTQAAIAVAEELNFSRAARRLRLSQPAVTKYVAELEESLGVLLFVRDHHSVSLTEAGRAYVEEARIAVLHAERAIHASRAAGKDAELMLNVGRSPYADPFFTSILLTMRLPLFPRLKLNLSSGFSCDLAREVLAGELDLALAIEPPLSDQFTSLKIDESPLYLVMSREDELAAHPSVKLCQLDQKRWMLFQRQSHPPLYDLIQKQAQQARIFPSALQHFLIPEETVPLLNSPGAVTIVGKSGAVRIARHGLTMRPLEEIGLQATTHLICRSDNDSRALGELVRCFVRRLNHYVNDEQMSLPLPV
ncbi:LysR family transcriptional regulator [Acidobacteria bacterium AB60]|nr:LysR family transcriptional regulator [Acidobacteria bacterium AB60]